MYPCSAWGQGYETPPILKASQVLEAEFLKGAHHKVKEDVQNDGYMNSYQVESEVSPFHARSTLRLRRLIRETYILAKLREISSSEVFVDAARRAGVNIAMAPVRGAQRAAELVTDPERMVDTVKGVPGGVARLFRSAGRTVQSGAQSIRDTHRRGSEEGYARAHGGAAVDAATGLASSAVGYSRAMRRWQREMMIDPYTTNEALNAELRRVVTVETSVGVGTFFVPGIGLGIPFVGTVDRYHRRADRLALFEDPKVIRKNNIAVIEELGDVNEGNAKAFLEHPAMTPTYRTLILDNLQSMKGVKNRGDFIDVAVQSNSEETTLFFLQASEQLLEYHRTVQPLDELVEGGLLPAGVTRRGQLIIILPVDHLVWTKDVDSIFRDFKARVQKEHAVSGSEARLTGSASARCKRELGNYGIRVVENLPIL